MGFTRQFWSDLPFASTQSDRGQGEGVAWCEGREGQLLTVPHGAVLPVSLVGHRRNVTKAHRTVRNVANVVTDSDGALRGLGRGMRALVTATQRLCGHREARVSMGPEAVSWCTGGRCSAAGCAGGVGVPPGLARGAVPQAPPAGAGGTDGAADGEETSTAAAAPQPAAVRPHPVLRVSRVVLLPGPPSRPPSPVRAPDLNVGPHPALPGACEATCHAALGPATDCHVATAPAPDAGRCVAVSPCSAPGHDPESSAGPPCGAAHRPAVLYVHWDGTPNGMGMQEALLLYGALLEAAGAAREEGRGPGVMLLVVQRGDVAEAATSADWGLQVFVDVRAYPSSRFDTEASRCVGLCVWFAGRLQYYTLEAMTAHRIPVVGR